MVVFLLLALLWTPPLVLIHELGHAAAALRLTSGPVLVKLGSGDAFGVRRGRLALAVSWPAGGECIYLARTLRGPARSEAWIAAAGPAASLVTAVLLGLAAVEAHGALRDILGAGAFVSAFATLVTAPPLRYGAGLGRRGESDGMAVWRILRGGPPRAARSGEPAVAGAVYLVLLALVAALAFLVDVGLGLLLIGIFAVALVLQSEKTA